MFAVQRLLWLTHEICDTQTVFKPGNNTASAYFRGDFAECLTRCTKIRNVYDLEKSMGIKKGSVSAKQMAEVNALELGVLHRMNAKDKAHSMLSEMSTFVRGKALE